MGHSDKVWGGGEEYIFLSSYIFRLKNHYVSLLPQTHMAIALLFEWGARKDAG